MIAMTIFGRIVQAHAAQDQAEYLAKLATDQTTPEVYHGVMTRHHTEQAFRGTGRDSGHECGGCGAPLVRLSLTCDYCGRAK